MRRFRKYGNRKTTVDGLIFDSKAEAKRWQELQLLQKAGLIDDLERQVRFDFHINGKPVKMENGHVMHYTADFTYTENGHQVVEDKKGMVTPDYRIRRALMKAIYNVKIRET